MLFALSPGGLYDLIVNADVDPFDNPIAGSKICVTPSLLQEYERYFDNRGLTERALYEAFVRSVHARLKAVEASADLVARASFPEQVAAATYGGKNLATAAGCRVAIDDARLLAALGVRVGGLEDLFETTCLTGFEPFERFVTHQGGSGAPDELTRFFRGEKDAVFYDRFVNDSSLDLIEYLVSCMDSGGNILIATSDRCVIDIQEIRRRVARWAHPVSVAKVDRDTTFRLHDRHIFVGRHYQLHVSRGLDIFGRSPSWARENGRVDVYDCHRATTVEVAFLREGGTSRRSLRLPAAVIA